MQAKTEDEIVQNCAAGFRFKKTDIAWRDKASLKEYEKITDAIRQAIRQTEKLYTGVSCSTDTLKDVKQRLADKLKRIEELCRPPGYDRKSLQSHFKLLNALRKIIEEIEP